MANLTNHFLVAMPDMHDQVFNGSVVYLTEHTLEGGAVGIIINKPLGRTIKNAFENIDVISFNPKWEHNLLYLGGPVNANNGFILHRIAQRNGKLFEITNNCNDLYDIAKGKYGDDILVAIGYSAWSTLQLELEIMSNSWLVVKAELGLIFEVDPVDRYNEAMRLLGIKSPASLHTGEIIIT